MDLVVVLSFCMIFASGDQHCVYEYQRSMSTCLQKKYAIIDKQHTTEASAEARRVGITQVHVWCDFTVVEGVPV